MPSKREIGALFDIRDNCRLAQEFSEALTLEAFASDRLRVYAVTRCLEIVSEASRRLSQELRDRHPELPWRNIMDVGNVYRHAYDNVEEGAVWRVLQHRLAPLLAAVEAEIANLPEVPAQGSSEVETAGRDTGDAHRGEDP